jgi:hypothetical protein
MTTQAPDTPVLAKTLIPADLHDRAYLKSWLDKPWSPELAAEVFKKLDGAEALVGKKTLIPGADAKDEEVESFFSKLRAEKPEDYEVSLAQVNGDKGAADEEFTKALRQAFHGAGVDKRQAAKFQTLLKPVFEARAKAAADHQAKLDAEFDTLTKAAFGGERDKVLARVTPVLKEHAPDAVKSHIDKLDNNALVLLTAVVDGLLKKYAPGEDTHNKDGGGEAQKESLREEARKLLADPAFKDFQNPNHEKVRTRVEEIYAQLAK